MSSWLTVTGSFEMGESEEDVFSFMGNVGAVNHLLTSTATPIEWDNSALSQVYLVLSGRRASTELEVSPEEVKEPDLLMFSVTYNWMTEEFLNPRTGPWHLLSHVALILARLDDDHILRVPTLTDPED